MSDRPSGGPGRPWPALGLGWIICVVVLLLAILSFVVPISVPHLDTWLVIGLCLAILL